MLPSQVAGFRTGAIVCISSPCWAAAGMGIQKECSPHMLLNTLPKEICQLWTIVYDSALELVPICAWLYKIFQIIISF